MINTAMRKYYFRTYIGMDEYAQATLSLEPVGIIKMAISISNQAIQDNINYKNATYIGLTKDANVDDTYVISYGEELLKVLYVNPQGRYKQVFMTNI